MHWRRALYPLTTSKLCTRSLRPHAGNGATQSTRGCRIEPGTTRIQSRCPPHLRKHAGAREGLTHSGNTFPALQSYAFARIGFHPSCRESQRTRLQQAILARVSSAACDSPRRCDPARHSSCVASCTRRSRKTKCPTQQVVLLGHGSHQQGATHGGRSYRRKRRSRRRISLDESRNSHSHTTTVRHPMRFNSAP